MYIDRYMSHRSAVANPSLLNYSISAAVPLFSGFMRSSWFEQ
jgi:hypothetical protein